MSSQDFSPTHVAPPEGLQAWEAPDPARPPIAQISGGVQMRLMERRGAWGRVLFANGWSGWVDGRRIVDVAPRPQSPAPVPPVPVTPDAAPEPGQARIAPQARQAQPRQQPRQPEPAPQEQPAPQGEPRPRPIAQPIEQPAWDTSVEPEPVVPAPAPVSEGQRKPAPGPVPVPVPAQHERSRSQARSMPDLGSIKVTPALIGAAAILIGSLLSWIRIAGQKGNAFDVPATFLIDYNTTARGGLKVGIFLLVLAGAVGALCFVPGRVQPRRIVGGVAVAVALLYTVQLQRALSAGQNAPSLPSALGFGVLVVLAGGAAVIVDRSDTATSR